MITRQEAERIAAAIHALRPEWPIQQVITLCGELMTWPLIDLGVGLAYVALDPATKSPYRIKEQGPWRTIGTSNPDAEEAAARADREHRQRMAGIEERRRAVAACHLCDSGGYLPSGVVCAHTDEAGRAHRGVSMARANIRPCKAPDLKPPIDSAATGASAASQRLPRTDGPPATLEGSQGNTAPNTPNGTNQEGTT